MSAADPLRSKTVPTGLALRSAPWRRRCADLPATVLHRVRAAQWYLARMRCGAAAVTPCCLRLRLLRKGVPLEDRFVAFHRLADVPAGESLREAAGEQVAWFQTPRGATHAQWVVVSEAQAQALEEPALHPVSERDPKCHPLAAPPRWSAVRPPFALQRVVLPEDLHALAPLIAAAPVRTVTGVPARGDLPQLVRGGACVVSPEWVQRLGLTLSDLEALARSGWLIVDLGTLAALARRSGVPAEMAAHASPHGLMSARVEFADVPTRGFALQDVLPFSVRDGRGRFAIRALRTNRGWRRYADDVGFATLLACETPWARRHGDALSLMRAVGGGELIATDLPWLVAGMHGPLVAPRIAAHLLRMHLGEPLEDGLQYWNRGQDWGVLIRDIAELATRFAALRPVRWRSSDSRVAHLGLRLSPAARSAEEGWLIRELLIQTGRIDDQDRHDGLPAEPMMIWLKSLAREVHEETAWARQFLAHQAVTWQFDTAVGHKYAVQFAAATDLGGPLRCLRVRMDRPDLPPPMRARCPVVSLREDEGLLGDGSLTVLHSLFARLRRAIEDPAAD